VKKMKWLGATGAVLALGAAGFVGTSTANAAAPVIQAGSGSKVTCNISGSMKITPTLADPWLHSDHSGANADSNANATVKAAMASIADDSTWVANGGANEPLTSSAKAASTLCTGTVTDGSNTDAVTAASITFGAVTAPVSPTCAGVVNIVGSTFQTVIKWTGTPDKIQPTTVNWTSGIAGDAHGAGLLLTSGHGDVTGATSSFLGSSDSSTTGYVDGNTIAAFAAGPPTFDAPLPGGSCEPSISEKFTPAAPGTSDAIALKLKKPKGLKGIDITAAPDSFPSHLCFNQGVSAC
jgi:hypothetical protein